MSQSQDVAAGEKIVGFCPFCGSKYSEPAALNNKFTCDPDAGCGITFLVKKF